MEKQIVQYVETEIKNLNKLLQDLNTPLKVYFTIDESASKEWKESVFNYKEDPEATLESSLTKNGEVTISVGFIVHSLNKLMEKLNHPMTISCVGSAVPVNPYTVENSEIGVPKRNP